MLNKNLSVREKNDAAIERKSNRIKDAIFELPGDEPLWIWAYTCPKKNCDCRDAVILVSDKGVDRLLEGIAIFCKERAAGTSYPDLAPMLEEYTPFNLDIDSVDIADLAGNSLQLDLAHPRIAALIDRIDGEFLDAIARLWFIHKGYPDQREMVLQLPSITIPSWRLGNLLAYCEVFKWVRSDLYFLEGIPPFEAIDLYCIEPKCDCAEVKILFEQLNDGDPTAVGTVDFRFSGAIEFQPEPGQKELLDRLWAAYRKRHPSCLSRLQQRYADMKYMGSKTTNLNLSPKVGRNEPCPCGSGKKYKKCCGANR